MTAKRKSKAPRKAAKPRTARAAPAKEGFAEFMKRAYAMELEASTRYAEFADQMEVANNSDVAQLFRKLAGIEKLHAKKILEQMGWKTPPADLEPFRWEGLEGAETGETNDLHYLMLPYHALQIALRNEERAARFFASIARRDLPRAVLDAAHEMAEEEREHVELVKAWMARVPKP
jgi:rubrerythrin